MASEKVTFYRTNEAKTEAIEQLPKTVVSQVYDSNNEQFLDETLVEITEHSKNSTNKKHIEVVSSVPTNLSESGILFKVDGTQADIPSMITVDVLSQQVSDLDSDLAAISSRVRSIVDIEGATFGAKINNAIASGVKYLNLEEYGDYSLAPTDYIRYSNITINGNGATIRSSLPDKQLVGHNVHIKNVKFIDTATSDNNSVFMLSDAKNVSFEGCEFTTTLRHVFRLFGEDGKIITNLKIKDCKFDNINVGLTFYGEFDTIIFDGNEFSNVKDNVISGVGEGSTPEMTKKRFIFKNNIVHDCGRMIVEIKRSNGIFIKNNDFRDNDWYTLSLIGCTDIVISDNQFSSTGIEIGPETGTNFPVKNVQILNNTFTQIANNSIELNAGTSGNFIESVLISGNYFGKGSSNSSINYAGDFENIYQLIISQNIFSNASNIRIIGVFQNNNIYADTSYELAECYSNAVIQNNIWEINPRTNASNSNILKVSGDEITIDNNIFYCNAKVFSAMSDIGTTRQNLTITNNRIYDGKNKALSFTNNTTFLNTYGNTAFGNTSFDGNDFDEGKALVQNLKMGVYQAWGNPNADTRLNSVARGSLCIDAENGKLYVKESTASPYWIAK